MDDLNRILKQYWGFDDYLPLQNEAMQCVMGGRDSLVVLPTGGGKSLCFQAPALAMPGMAVVISPLISLMKDQVDTLRANGVVCAKIDSTMTAAERMETHEALQARRIKLLYVSPERMAQPAFRAYLKNIGVTYFVVDEAHCISHWGHDFRPEYRALRALRDHFPNTGIHAYTATATEHVQQDILSELRLHNPATLIGDFDRPNLNYRTLQRQGGMKQVMDMVAGRKDESGIIYCLRRADVDHLCALLTTAGYKALPYHAGMSDPDRKRNQEAFSKDEADIVVATVAFGMGIDKSNVRYVLHAAMPKSIEHYQQETGRAGRDGLPADCWLLYSYQDFRVWQSILAKSEENEAKQVGQAKLRDMMQYCQQLVCRHKALSEYFGQSYDRVPCDACDVCAGQLEVMADAQAIAKEILNAARVLGSVAGPHYTTLVLIGSREERILNRRHDHCPAFGQLKAHGANTVRDWIEQLTQQGYLEKRGEYNILAVTDKGMDVLEGDAQPRLLEPAKKPKRTRAAKAGAPETDATIWVDPELFQALRQARLEEARDRGIPPFVVFSDATLRDMARRMPEDHQAFMAVQGVGAMKCEVYGDRFIAVIQEYRSAHPDLPESTGVEEASPIEPVQARRLNKTFYTAEALFKQGCSIETVAERTGRKPSTIESYLVQYFQEQGRTDAAPWVTAEIMESVRRAFVQTDEEFLKPVFEKLNGEVPYWKIRLCKVCLENQAESDS